MKELTKKEVKKREEAFFKWYGNEAPIDTYTKCCKKPMSSYLKTCYQCENSSTGLCEPEVDEEMLKDYHPVINPYEETK